MIGDVLDDYNLIKENDRILIIGNYEEDQIVSHYIATHWTHTHIKRFNENEYHRFVRNIMFSSFWGEPKNGSIYITTANNVHVDEKNMSNVCLDEYNWILSVKHNNTNRAGFSPFIIHKK